MGAFWRKARKQRKPFSSLSATDRAVLDIKRHRDRVQHVSALVQRLLQHEGECAQRCLRMQQVNHARFYLKRRALQQRRLDQLFEQVGQLEQLVARLENAVVTEQVYKALKTGQIELDRLQAQCNIEKIEQFMTEAKETIERQMEIDLALCEPLFLPVTAAQQPLDVDEQISNELNSLLQEVKVQGVISKPNNSSDIAGSQQKDEIGTAEVEPAKHERMQHSKQRPTVKKLVLHEI